jgi:hypothetical protein
MIVEVLQRIREFESGCYLRTKLQLGSRSVYEVRLRSDESFFWSNMGEGK